MKKIILTLLISSVFYISLKAQRYLGLETGNWSGTNCLYLNPALGADNREKFSIDLVSLNAGADNNLGTVSNFNSLINRAFSGGTFSVSNFLNYSNNAQFSLVAPYIEARGPGFLLNIKGKHTIALTTRLRAMNQFNNFDQNLYRIITDPSHLPNQDLYHVTSQNFNWTAHLWSEVGLTYSTVLITEGHSRVKLGGTLRYLGGVGYLGIKGNNLNVTYVNSKDSLNAQNSAFTYASNVLSADNAFVNGLSTNTLINSLFGPKSASGIGGDIGIIYEYRTEFEDHTEDGNDEMMPDKARNGYKFRLGASVTDLGAITYNSGNYNAYVQGNGTVTSKDFASNINNFTNFFTYVASRGFTADTTGKSTKVYMPTALNLSGDYHIKKKFYVAAVYLMNLANRQNFGNSFYNQFSVIPRFDMRNYSIALPITYSQLAGDMKVGVMFRFFGFFIGSDDALAFVSNSNYGFNFYAGGHVPINNKKLRDRDHDGIPDKYDACPDEPGSAENKGCPESDSEHGGSNDDKY